MSSSVEEQLDGLLADLDVPSSLAAPESTAEETIAHLTEWKRSAVIKLNQLRALLLAESDAQNVNQKPTFPLEKQADVIAVASAFYGEGSWVTSDSQAAAADILGIFAPPSIALLRHVLAKNVKPIFQANPHPYVNLSTGRKLARPAGGPLASQDYYENQTWKKHPGAPNLVLWCVRNIESNAWEDLWHLIVPPLMTLLDDYEARYKRRGAEIVAVMLESVPKGILKRTGIDSLLRTSLNNALTHLQSPETPALIRAAIPAALKLTLHTTEPGSAERFDQLCALLGDGIIGTIWVYSSLDLAAVQASTYALPPVIDALGIGCTRYLKALVPQLTHPLIPVHHISPDSDWQIASLRALSSVIDQCAPRMHAWRGAIIEGVGKAWVTSIDSGSTQESTIRLQSELITVCQKLARACPSVIQEEYVTLLAAEHDMFQELLGDLVVGVT